MHSLIQINYNKIHNDLILNIYQDEEVILLIYLTTYAALAPYYNFEEEYKLSVCILYYTM